MTQSDIMGLAAEANLWVTSDERLDAVKKFAALVAAAEREACAQECLMPVDEIQITDDCSEYVYKDHLDCAEAIRARGQHGD